MKSLLFCMLGLAMTACAPRKAGNVNNGNDELAMLVGTYTDGNSKGIYTFRFNQETGLATSLSSIEVLNPSYLIPSEDGRFVYAVSEMNDTTAALNAFSFDKETGKLSLLSPLWEPIPATLPPMEKKYSQPTIAEVACLSSR